MKILALDSSNQALAVALLEDDRLVADFTLNVKKNHSISLMPAIDFLVAQAGWQPKDLERVVVAQGPGSYTGLRVAVATAKTLAYTLKIDLVGVSSLYALAAETTTSGLVVPLINARRNNVYAGFYENGKAIRPDSHMALAAVLESVSQVEKVTFVGEVTAFQDQIAAVLPQATICETLPSAAALGKYGQELEAVAIDSFVPDYLKRVEAEENWLKDHQAGDEANYVKRV